MQWNRKLIIIISVAVVSVTTGAFFLFGGKGKGKTPNPRLQKPDEIRQYLRSEEFRNLDPNDRRAYARQAFMQMTTQRVEEYAKVPAEQRIAYLDKVIDEMQARREQFRTMRGQSGRRGDKTRTANRQQQDRQSKVNPQQQDRPFRANRDSRRGGGSGRRGSPARRRARSEYIDPKIRALRTEFRQALRKRMEQRGIEFGGRGSGQRGGSR